MYQIKRICNFWWRWRENEDMLWGPYCNLKKRKRWEWLKAKRSSQRIRIGMAYPVAYPENRCESLHYHFVASDPWWTRGRTRAPAHTQRCYMWVSQLQSSFPMARGTTATSWRCPCQRRIALLFNYTIKLLILFFSHTCSSRKMHQCSGQRAVFWNFILFIYFYYSSCKRLDGARKNHSTQN